MKLLLLPCLLLALNLPAQIRDAVYAPYIKSAQLYVYGNQLTFPVMRLNSTSGLELHFDDVEGGVKSYSYTFQLCNADWTPAMLSHFDFIKGFSQQRIGIYRPSSVAFTRYTHYQASLPDPNCAPSRAGNYILKVFLNGDTSRTVFTKRLLVLEEKASVSAQIQQPFNGQIFRTHQKLQMKVLLNEKLNVVNHFQQLNVVVLQNYRWDNALFNVKPSFFSRNTLDFNSDDAAVFPAGKEWRWVDLRSFRFQSDRIASAKYGRNSTDIVVKPDKERVTQQFNFFRDMNGLYSLETTESLNPLWQTDYGWVHFSYVPSGNIPFPDKDIYLFGKLTNYNLDDSAKMKYNADLGVYETTLFLKQGYYDYCYVTIDQKDPKRQASFEFTEGNYWDSENEYTILVYYRPMGGRSDELICVANINSLTGRKAIGN